MPASWMSSSSETPSNSATTSGIPAAIFSALRRRIGVYATGLATPKFNLRTLARGHHGVAALERCDTA